MPDRIPEHRASYNLASSELLGLAAHGHYRHAALTDRWGKYLPPDQIEENQARYTGLLREHQAAFEAAVLRKAAADIKASCPDHSTGEESFISCQCAAADQMTRWAARAGEQFPWPEPDKEEEEAA